MFLVFLTAGFNSQAQDVPENLSATIHIDQTGEPINPFLYGMFSELLHNMFEGGIWAEMISDRKFFYPVDNSEDLVPGNSRRGQKRWRPVGPEENVVMDMDNIYVGKHSPKVLLNGNGNFGIRQEGFWLRNEKEYDGRVVLCGDPEIQVEVSLVWGSGENERQTIKIDHLTDGYMKYPLYFSGVGDTNEGSIEIIGKGKGSFNIGAVSLMPADNVHGYRRDLIDILKELNSGIYRLVGGNFVSNYNWRNGIGDPDRRPPRYDYAWNCVEPNDVGTDELITMCELINVEPYIVVNCGFGDAQSAAAWVEYVNGSEDSPNGMLRAANGHPEPYGVKYWGIGNEMYGEWQMGHMVSTQYSIKHNFFAEAMWEVDPTIKIIGCGASLLEEGTTARHRRSPLPSELPFEYLSVDDWSGTLLSGSYQNMDFIAEHAYPPFNMHFDKEKQEWIEHELTMTERIKITPGRIKGAVECMKVYEERIPGLADKKMTIWIDEWVSGGDLGTAASLHEIFRNSKYYSMSGYTGFSGLYSHDQVNATISPTGQLFKLYRTKLGTLPVDVTGNSPVKPLDGTKLVDIPSEPPGSETYPLDVFAAINKDKTKLTVSVVNPLDSEQGLNLNFEGGDVSNTAKYWTLTPPERRRGVGGQIQEPEPLEEGEITSTSSINVKPLSVMLFEFDLE
ncbi:MAG TPA: hypothetical protein VEP89_10610 [Draconibacterium sp.]|nr:hypothetical protein [Draconibacterium sp.]